MFGRVSKEAVFRNVGRALDALDFKYENQDGMILLSAMGDDLPIGMVITADDDCRTLNIYCYLMFEVPPNARAKLIQELNTLNNQINNGNFFMSDDEPKIYFKIIQSYLDSVPSVEMVKHLVMIAFQTVDVNDGKLKDLIPEIRRDFMYS